LRGLPIEIDRARGSEKTAKTTEVVASNTIAEKETIVEETGTIAEVTETMISLKRKPTLTHLLWFSLELRAPSSSHSSQVIRTKLNSKVK